MTLPTRARNTLVTSSVNSGQRDSLKWIFKRPNRESAKRGLGLFHMTMLVDNPCVARAIDVGRSVTARRLYAPRPWLFSRCEQLRRPALSP